MAFGVHGSSQSRTYVSNTGKVLPSGFVPDLGVEQIGFFKVDKTRKGVADIALAAPTAQLAPSFKLGIGRKSYPAQDSIANVSKFPLLTQELKGTNIIGWRGTKAENEPSTEIYTLGYDGVDARKRLHAAIDRRELLIQIRLYGNPIRKLTGIRKDLIRQYYISKGVVDKCIDICEATPGLADELIADDLIKQIKADKFNMIPITNFVRVTKLRKSADGDTPLTGLVASTRFTLSLCDDGSSSSLGNLQAQYPGFKIKTVSRFGSTSTYEMWRLDTQGDPAVFVNTLPVALAVCDVCPAGYTLSPALTVYTVQRPVESTTDLSTSGARQTYANTIGTAYGNASRRVLTVAGGGGTGYTNGVFPLTFTGGGGNGATGTVTVAGGIVGTPVVTNGGLGYTSAPSVTAPGVTGGTGAAAFTATISATSVVSSTFISNDGGVATVFVSSSAPLTSGPLFSDAVSSTNASEYCVPPVGDNITWTEAGTATAAPAQWMLTLGDTICGESRLGELQMAYPDLVIAEQGSAANCARIYTTTTYSDPVEPDECSIEDYTFTTPENFLRNVSWVPFQTPLVNPVCEVEEVVAPCVAAGVKFETAAFIHNFSDCVYGYYSWDLADVDPVYIEISSHTHDWTADTHYSTDQIITKLRGTKFTTGQGGHIRQQERSTLQYEGFIHTTNPAFNEAWGTHFAAQQHVFYDTYHLTVETNNSPHAITGKNGTSNQMTYTFAFPSGMGKDYERLINGYIVSLGNPDLQPVVL